jgi:hypothetical protein
MMYGLASMREPGSAAKAVARASGYDRNPARIEALTMTMSKKFSLSAVTSHEIVVSFAWICLTDFWPRLVSVRHQK